MSKCRYTESSIYQLLQTIAGMSECPDQPLSRHLWVQSSISQLLYWLLRVIVARSTFLRKYFPKSSVPHIFGRHFLAVDFWLRWFLPIFACRGGPGSAARCGGGPRGTQKLIKQKFLMRVFCPHEPLRKYFRSVFSARTDHYENIFEAFFLCFLPTP